jgi:rfaE bifunctional protein nucleotidyltransferase chain/domain
MGDKMKIVYTYSVLDLVHAGHVLYLENAKALGDKLILGILTNEAVMEKKPKPILSFSERMGLAQALKCVDCVVAQDTYSPIRNLKSIQPDIHIESSSHSEKDLKVVKGVAKKIGCKVIVLPYYPEQSSSSIKEQIKNERRIKK